MVGAIYRRWWWLGAIGLMAVAATGVLWDFPARSETSEPTTTQKAPRPVTVTTSPVTIREVPRYVPIVGTLFGLEEIEIRPQVDGPVVRYHHDVADKVHPGDLLFEIDPKPFQLAVNEAERAVEWERANLGLLRVPAEQVDVNKLPGVVDAALNRDQSKRNFERAQQLWNQRTITKEEWEKSETDFKRAEALLQKSIDTAQASLASMRQKEAKLASDRKKLEDTKVTVPLQPTLAAKEAKNIEYLVADRNVTEGEMVAHGLAEKPAYRLVIADSLKLEAAIAERHASEVKADQPAGILTEATGDKIFYGRVVRVHPAVDRVSRTFRVEVEIPNTESELHPGSFGKGMIRTHLDPNARTVPAESIVRFAGVVKIFVVRDSKAIAVPVKLGERTEIKEGSHTRVWFEVTGDLKPDEPVVTSGQSQLSEGVPVVVRQPLNTGEPQK